MAIYAQLDLNNVCIGVSQLSSEIDLPNMIEIDDFSYEYIGKKYEDNKWGDSVMLPIVKSEINSIDMLGTITTQNALELTEVKEILETLGRGMVEIILQE